MNPRVSRFIVRLPLCLLAWLVFTFGPPGLFSQTVAVQSTLTDGSDSPVGGKLYLHFVLQNCGANIPINIAAPAWKALTAYVLNQEVVDAANHLQKITTAGTSGATIPTFNDSAGTTSDGSAVWTDQGVAPISAVVKRSFDLVANSSGVASGVVIPNDLIKCGGVLGSTQWQVAAMASENSPITQAQTYFICSNSAVGVTCAQPAPGATFNLVSAQPASVSPPAPGFVPLFDNPTESQTLNQPFGTQTNFQGTMNFCSATVLCAGGLGAGTLPLGCASNQIAQWNGSTWVCANQNAGGSVTNFSAGNLSPLFTTSVATSTSTPALTFNLSNAPATSVFGNFTGGSAAPGFSATPTLTGLTLAGISGSTQCLHVNSAGLISGTGSDCGSGGGGTVTGSGTTNTLPIWSSSSALGNSHIQESAINGFVTTTEPVSLTASDTNLRAPLTIVDNTQPGSSCTGQSFALTDPNGSPACYAANIGIGATSTSASISSAAGMYLTASNLKPVTNVLAGLASIATSVINHSVGELRGVHAQASDTGGPVTTSTGLFAESLNSDTGQTLTTARAIYAVNVFNNQGSGNSGATNSYGVYVDSPQITNNTSTLTHNYGLFIADQAAAGAGVNSDPHGVHQVGNAPNEFQGHINQIATGNWAGSCAMSAGTTCTFSISAAYTGTPLSFVSLDGASTPPATAISVKCAVSGTTVTITAGASNSLTWDCLLIGNPN